MKYAFAGDRNISVRVLSALIGRGHKPEFLFVSSSLTSTHDEKLIEISELPNEKIFRNKDINLPEVQIKLKNANLDYIFGIHFPYIIQSNTLNIPKVGFLNLHPAYLPYNKGWHTPSWAIFEGTPYGATLHFMSEKLDEGNIIHQKRIEVSPDDTADTLYKKVLDLEFDVFVEALPSLINLKPNNIPQNHQGTSHNKKELASIQKLELAELRKTSELIDQLRALTTNNLNEAAFFIQNDKKYAVTIAIKEIDEA